MGTLELAETARFNYTSAKVSLEALTEDWASDVAVRLAETKANSAVPSCQQMLRLISTTFFQVQTETAEEMVVERLVKTNLPRLPPGPTATIDQIAYEFYKQALAILD